MLMMLIPSRLTVNFLFRWMGFKDTPGDTLTRSALDLGYLGAKHYRFSPDTARIMPAVFSDDELRALHMPVLLLIGDREVIYDPAKAFDRARALIPNLNGELVPGANHNMCASHYQLVDARMLEFLSNN
jgi:pimeloyl-ACP methyl ester carboxylesterase